MQPGTPEINALVLGQSLPTQRRGAIS